MTTSGWTNEETRLITGFILNDEGLYQSFKHRAPITADELEIAVTDLISYTFDELGEGIEYQLTMLSLSRVDWAQVTEELEEQFAREP